MGIDEEQVPSSAEELNEQLFRKAISMIDSMDLAFAQPEGREGRKEEHLQLNAILEQLPIQDRVEVTMYLAYEANLVGKGIRYSVRSEVKS